METARRKRVKERCQNLRSELSHAQSFPFASLFSFSSHSHSRGIVSTKNVPLQFPHYQVNAKVFVAAVNPYSRTQPLSTHIALAALVTSIV